MEQPNENEEAPPVVYVSFSADISPEAAGWLTASLAECANAGVEEVRLLLSTSGGDVMSGITLYNTLRAMPFKLVTHNVGNVDSIGISVYLAGDERFACETATFMFHGTAFETTEGQVFDSKVLRDSLIDLEAEEGRLGAILAERTNLSSEEIGPLFERAQTKNAADALDLGIVNEIKAADIPPGIPVLAPGLHE